MGEDTMRWLICGSVPDAAFPLTRCAWRFSTGTLMPEGADAPPLAVQRGTPALIAAACLTCRASGAAMPEALLAGDTGSGEGSRRLYDYLSRRLEESAAAGDPLPDGLTFHYLYPDADGHNRVLMAVQGLSRRPLLVADAGYMYVAKMSGYAAEYDVFTPDAGELAFLADENAPHPFYTRGFLLAEENDVPGLIRRAYAAGNAARFLLAKGASDRIARDGEILGEVDSPSTPALEAVGGTGDLVTGILTGLLASGLPLREACFGAARAARLAGSLAAPTPATQIAEILPFVPEALAGTGLCPFPGADV